MRIYLSHQSALEYWRYTAKGLWLHGKAQPPRRTTASSLDADIAAANLGKYGFDVSPDSPLHVLVPDGAAVRYSALKVCHVCPKKLPAGSFLEVEEGLVVSSPELCFLQMAASLSLPQLIELGFEFCGTYGIPNERNWIYSDEADVDRITERPAITSAARLSAYIERAGNVRGIDKARIAVRYVVDNSYSPMETKLVLLLCLPVRYGGYGLPLPELNPEIQFGDEARVLSRRTRCFPDIYWRSASFDLEYNGKRSHSGQLKIQDDDARRSALMYEGVDVVVLTARQVYDEAIFAVEAELIAKKIGKRLRLTASGVDKRRSALRRELLGGKGEKGIPSQVAEIPI